MSGESRAAPLLKRPPTPRSRSLLRLVVSTLVLGFAKAGTIWSESVNANPFIIDSLPITFFPPWTPTLGGRLYEASPPSRYNGRELTPPEGMADFVNEYFYPALGTRLFRPGLSDRLQEQFDAYRARRTTLINELTEKLALLEPVDATTRAAELAAFAASQHSRIIALEAEAEQLRDQLIRGSLLQNSADWSAQRAWKLGERPFTTVPSTKAAEFHVIRAAAFYQLGLSVEQRGLLREVHGARHPRR